MKKNIYLKLIYLSLIIPSLMTLCSCTNKEEILNDLIDGMHWTTTFAEKVDRIIYESGKSCIPAECSVITTHGSFDLPISWKCNSNDISLRYGTFDSKNGPDYTIFLKKIYANPYYLIDINKFNDQRTDYVLTAAVEDRGVSYSQNFTFTVGSKVDAFVVTLNDWSVDGDSLKYYKHTYEERYGQWQGRPDTYSSDYSGTYNLNTHLFHYSYSHKEYHYPSITTTSGLVADYNAETQALTYKGETIYLNKTYSQSYYNNYCSRGVDFNECSSKGLFSRIRDLDKFFIFSGHTSFVSVFYNSGSYTNSFLFNISQS